MDWRCDINWYAIQTKRFRERVAACGVSALGLETFLPLVRVESPAQAVIKLDRKPLFPAYFFARFSPTIFLEAVDSARGVVHVVRAGFCPIPLEDRVVREIQDRVEADGLIRLERRQFKPGDWVSVQEGPFGGMMGRVEAELDDRKRVAVLLEALWNARVLIEKSSVKFEVA